jgi:glutathione S-transferase
MSITLYQFEISPYADKVRRALRWKGLDFETHEIRLTRRNRYRQLSPTGKFPVIVHDGQTIVDSTDILRFLDARFPEKPLRPDDPRDAALATILEDWADESLYFFDLTMRPWPQNRAWFVNDLLAHEPPGLVRTLLAGAIPGAIAKLAKSHGLGRKSEATVVADLAALYDALETLVSGADWLAGPRLSGADLSVRAMVNVLDRTVEAAALRKTRPALDAWCRRVDAEAPAEGLSAPGTPPG